MPNENSSGFNRIFTPKPNAPFMDPGKFFNPRQMNTFQVIAVTGLIMTGLAHLVLRLVNKEIPSFEMLYGCWLVLYFFGLLRNLYAKPHDDDHHHH